MADGVEKPLLGGGEGPAAAFVEAASGLPLWLPIMLCLFLTLSSAASGAKSLARALSSALERGLRSYLGASLSVWVGTKILKKLLRALRRRRAASTRRGRSYGSASALDSLAGPQLPNASLAELETTFPG